MYFTVLGEPTIKMLRYQQQFAFFDMSKVNTAVQFANLSDEVLTTNLGQVLEAIVGTISDSVRPVPVAHSRNDISRNASTVVVVGGTSG